MRKPPSDWLTLAGVSACFVLSGFAALLYQTAWLRQFSIVFGTSELAVATVLAAYMAGLGAGAAIAARYADRLRRPVLVYGLLEAGIAITALAVPVLLTAAGWLHVLVLGGQSDPPDAGGLAQPVYYLLISFLILALPTGFMGATLPLLTRYAVQQNAQVGPRVAWLYGINTAGAVFGTIAGAFWLLPKIGLRGTVLVGVGVNVAVFLLAAAIARSAAAAQQTSDGTIEAEQTGARAPQSTSLRAPFWILPIMLVSGANAFLYEVLWTRILNHALGGTIYAFATMLASFLAGIAIGGMLAGKVAGNRRQAVHMFAVAQAAIGLLSAGIYYWLQGYVPDESGLAANATVAALVLFPATLFIGATFPLAVRILAAAADEAPVATGRTYAWNTVGAIVGSILAGFLLIPALGFEGAIRLAVGVNLALAMVALFLVAGMGLRTVAPAALACGVALLLYRPMAPLGLIDTSVVDAGRGGQPIYYAVGRSATVFLKRLDGIYYLRTNGLPEAFVEPAGAPPLRHSQKWLTALPVIARPDAESMLIIGFGGGVAVEGVPPTVADVDVIELEPEVLAANAAISDVRRYDPLDDERVRIVINDARNAIYLTDKRYDVIVSQPSHPWTAGASHLYTSEFIGLSKQHLSSDGVYVQWINSLFVDEALLRTLTATLLEHFPNVRIYQPAPTILLFLASEASLDVEEALAQSGEPLNSSVLHYSYIGINAVEDLLIALTADDAAVRSFAEGAPVNTDNNNRLAMFARSATDGLNGDEVYALFAPSDPLLNPDSWIHRDLPQANLSFVAWQLITTGFPRRAGDLARTTNRPALAHTTNGLGLRHAGLSRQSDQALLAALDADPDYEPAQYALIWSYLGRLAEGDAPERITAVAARLEGSAAAVVDGWKLGIARRWSELAELDDVLSEARPTDIWYPEAVKLRADWRIQGSNDPATNEAALRIVDRALMINPLTDLLVIRAGAAVRLNDPRTFVETAQAVAQQMSDKLDRAASGELEIPARDLATMRLRVAGFAGQLDSDFISPVRQRAGEVRANLAELEARLAQF